MIAGFESLDAGAALDHFTTAFVAENAGKSAFGIIAGQGEGVGMADAGGHHFQQNLAVFWSFHFDFFDDQRFFRLPSHSGAGFHTVPSTQPARWKLFRFPARRRVLSSVAMAVDGRMRLLCRRQRLFQIGEDVVDVLDTDRQPHQILADPGPGQLFG